MARRTATTYQRFVDWEQAAQLTVFTCPQGVDNPADPACLSYDAADVVPFLSELPGVVAAGRYALGIAAIAPAAHPDQWQRQLLPISIDANAALGRPILVSGRRADPHVASEVEINESFRDATGLGVGDRVLLTPYRLDEFDHAGDGERPPTGAAMTMTIVGVVRRHGDLAAKLGVSGVYEQFGDLRVGPAWWQAVGGDIARYGLGVAVRTDGTLTKDDIVAAFRARWPGRPVDTSDEGVVVAQGMIDASEPIALQAHALEVVAAALALAAAALVGPTALRVARREWHDAATLSAMGADSRVLRRAAAARSVTIAVPAAALAALLSTALSPLGPVGVGRAAEVDPGLHVDAMVLDVGLPVLLVAVIIVGVLGARSQLRSGAREVTAHATGRHVVPSPTALAGAVMSRTRGARVSAIGSAIAGIALATAGVMAAWSIVASYDRMVREPARYGITWDATVGNVGSEAQRSATETRLRQIPGISAAGLATVSATIQGKPFVLESYRPLIGTAPQPPVTEGRPPVSSREVALGRDTMRDLGVHVGATVRLPPGDPEGIEVEVVGVTPINDLQVNRTGRGAFVTPELFDALAPGEMAQEYAVWLNRSADRTVTLATVRAAFPTTYLPPFPPGATRNLRLVRGQPVLLAALLAAVAAAVLVHALVLSVQANRRQLAVFKTLGFSRRQLAGAVAWHATSMAVVGAAIGVPLGVVLGRFVWGRLAANLGVEAGPVVPISAPLASTAVAFTMVNLVALVPAWLAARTRPAKVLREE
jgi:hypothetical protein